MFEPKYMSRMYRAIGGDGTGGDHSQHQQQQTDQNQQQQQNQQQTNNQQQQNNIEDNINPWEDDDTTSQQNNNQQQQTNNNNQQQQQSNDTDPLQALQERVAKIDFVQAPALTEAMRAAQEGNMDGLLNVFNNMGRTIFSQALTVGAQFARNAAKNAAEEAFGRSSNSMNMSFAIRELEAAIPEASTVEFGPVIRGVFSKFLGKGQTQEKAIQNTKKYMDSLANKFTGKGNKHPRRPGSDGYGERTGIPFDSQEEETDFLHILSGGTVSNQ